MKNLIIMTVYYFLVLLEFLLFVRVILSWIPTFGNNRFIEVLHTLTEPILSPIRAMIEKSIFGGKGTMLDFSPLVAFLILQLLQRYVYSLL